MVKEIDHKLNLPVREYEAYAKPLTLPGVINYNLLRILNRVYDDDNVVVEGTYLVEQKEHDKLQYTMNIVELTTEAAIMNTLREISILKILDMNKYIMGLYCEFRHRQFVAMMLPPFIPIRGHLDAKLRKRKELGTPEDEMAPFLFTSTAIAHMVKRVAKGLEYLHSKGFVHTELCANNVYINVLANVKIGGFVHAKSIGSKSHQFNGDLNVLPPECIVEVEKFKISPSIDAWSLGLLTLELITGKRHYLKDKKVYRLATEYLDGVRHPPTLGEASPGTVIEGVQEYSRTIDDFLGQLMDVDPRGRPNMAEVIRHPFLKKRTERRKVLHELAIGVDSFLEQDKIRSLFTEMMLCRGSCPDMADNLLKNVLIGLDHVNKGDYQLFKDIPDKDICAKYVGIEATIAIPYDDSNWSKDVLDISQDNFETKDKHLRPQAPYPQKQFLNEQGHPGLKKDYQRYEIVFFINKQWKEEDRQVFIAIQFGRWYDKGVIHFTDLIRVVDEVEEVFRDYVVKKKRLDPNGDPPETVYFASPQRAIRIDRSIDDDPKARFLEHIYVDVSLQSATNKKKLDKLRTLMEGEPVEFPAGWVPLQASVSFQDVDPSIFEALEAQMLGEMQVENWDFEAGQATADATRPETRLYRLLIERRRNYNKAFTPDTDGQWSNQARTEKIWGDYTRDFLFKVCKWAVPYHLEQDNVKELYGEPFRTKEEIDEAIRTATNDDDIMSLENQLWRTQLKQEEDTRDTFKRHEDTDLRRSAAMAYEGNKNAEYGLNQQLNKSPRRQFDNMATPKQPARRRWQKPQTETRDW